MTHKTLLAIITATVLSTSTTFAESNVSGGTLSFSGYVTDTTCTINGGDSASMSIFLDPISITQAGTTEGLIDSGKKAFSLEFSNCQTGGSQLTAPMLKLQFSSVNTISTSGTYLINQVTNAAGEPLNVGIALVKRDNENIPIQLNQVFETGINGSDPTPETVDLYAKYYKVGNKAAEPGQVSTMVTYSVTYM